MSPPPDVDEAAKGEYHYHEGAQAVQSELHRGLHARHVTMIAIGGAIGMLLRYLKLDKSSLVSY